MTLPRRCQPEAHINAQIKSCAPQIGAWLFGPGRCIPIRSTRVDAWRTRQTRQVRYRPESDQGHRPQGFWGVLAHAPGRVADAEEKVYRRPALLSYKPPRLPFLLYLRSREMEGVPTHTKRDRFSDRGCAVDSLREVFFFATSTKRRANGMKIPVLIFVLENGILGSLALATAMCFLQRDFPRAIAVLISLYVPAPVL
jgi:hypothetical protein